MRIRLWSVSLALAVSLGAQDRDLVRVAAEGGPFNFLSHFRVHSSR